MEEPNSLGPQDEGVHTLEHVDQYLQVGQESDASDIHLSVNGPPVWRRFGTLEPIWLQADKLTAEDTRPPRLRFSHRSSADDSGATR
jgi:twitching motility protein PilT